MKSKYLAKADFLRQLAKHTKALYELGDFTSDDPDRAKLSVKLEGFIEAGTLIEVATRDEIQAVIDKAHLAAFGEAREARRTRILEERASRRKKQIPALTPKLTMPRHRWIGRYTIARQLIGLGINENQY